MLPAANPLKSQVAFASECARTRIVLVSQSVSCRLIYVWFLFKSNVIQPSSAYILIVTFASELSWLCSVTVTFAQPSRRTWGGQSLVENSRVYGAVSTLATWMPNSGCLDKSWTVEMTITIDAAIATPRITHFLETVLLFVSSKVPSQNDISLVA